MCLKKKICIAKQNTYTKKMLINFFIFLVYKPGKKYEKIKELSKSIFSILYCDIISPHKNKSSFVLADIMFVLQM